MTIGAVQQNYNALFTQIYPGSESSPKTTSEDKSFAKSIETKINELASGEASKHSQVSDKDIDKSPMDPLDYYHELCKEYPGITFRLGDWNEGMKHTEPPYIGYNNSFNQVGDNFAQPGQISVQIDIAVIKNMQADPGYEESIKKEIQSAYAKYETDLQKSTGEGFPYIAYSIRDDRECRPGLCLWGSECRFSTEEEVRAMWNMDRAESDYKNIMLSLGINDKFFEMLDKAIEKSRESSGEREENIRHNEIQRESYL